MLDSLVHFHFWQIDVSYYHYYSTILIVLTPAVAEGFSLESECQQKADVSKPFSLSHYGCMFNSPSKISCKETKFTKGVYQREFVQ